MIDKLGGTKFLFAMLAIIGGFTLTVIGKMESDAFVNLVGMVGGTFVLGNVVNQISYDLNRKGSNTTTLQSTTIGE